MLTLEGGEIRRVRSRHAAKRAQRLVWRRRRGFVRVSSFTSGAALLSNGFGGARIFVPREMAVATAEQAAKTFGEPPCRSHGQAERQRLCSSDPRCFTSRVCSVWRGRLNITSPSPGRRYSPMAPHTLSRRVLNSGSRDRERYQKARLPPLQKCSQSFTKHAPSAAA